MWYTWLGVYKQPRCRIYDIPSLSARYCVAFGRSASTFSDPPLPPPPSVVSLSVSPDDGSGRSSRAVEIGLFIEYLTSLLGVVCVGVELAVVFVLLGFSQQVFPLKIWVFYCWFFPLGEVGLLPLNVAVCLAPAQFLFSLLSSCHPCLL